MIKINDDIDTISVDVVSFIDIMWNKINLGLLIFKLYSISPCEYDLYKDVLGITLNKAPYDISCLHLLTSEKK